MLVRCEVLMLVVVLRGIVFPCELAAEVFGESVVGRYGDFIIGF